MAPEPGDCICPVRASGTFPASFDSTAAFFRSLTYLHYGYGIVLPALVSGPSRIRSHRNVRVPQVANYGRTDFTADSVGRCEPEDRTQAPLRGRSNHDYI